MSVLAEVGHVHLQAGDINEIDWCALRRVAKRQARQTPVTSLVEKGIANYDFTARRVVRHCRCVTDVDPRNRRGQTRLAVKLAQVVVEEDRVSNRDAIPFEILHHRRVSAAARSRTEK